MKDNEFIIDTSLNADSVEAGAKDIEKAMRNVANTTEEMAKNMEKAVENAGNTREVTEEYAKMQKEVSQLEAKLDKLIEKEIRFNEIGGNTKSQTFKGYEYDIEQAISKIAELEAKMAEMRDAGTAFKPVEEEMQNVESEETQVISHTNLLKNTFTSLGGKVGSIVGKLGKGLFKGLSTSVNLARKSVNMLSKAFGALRARMEESKKSMNRGFKNVLKYAFGIRSIYILINKLRTAIVDGVKSMAVWNNGNNEVNKSMSMLSSASTNFKNSLGTAFAPILNTIAPALTKLINLCTEATNALGRFFAYLSGAGSFTKAVAVQKDFASSIEATGNSAKKASKQLAPFDELATIDKSNDSGSGSGSAQKVQYEVEQIDTNAFDKLMEKVRKAFDSGELGKTIGTSIGNALNKAFEIANNFINSIPWSDIGMNIATAINGFFETFDFSMAGKTISDAILGLLDLINTAVANTDWWQVGEGIRDFICGFDWGQIVTGIATAFGQILGALAMTVGGLIGEGIANAKDYFDQQIKDAGGNVVEGILYGIANALVNIGTWIKDHVFSPFINGFKNIFGIHSPSTVMAEMGGYIVQGLINGIKNTISKVVTLFVDTWTTIKNKTYAIFNTIRNVIVTIIGTIKRSIEEKFTAISEFWEKIWTGVSDVTTNIFNGIWDAIKFVINGIISGIEWMANSVIKGINTVISGMNALSFDMPDWLGGAHFGFDISKLEEISIPRLATGTVVPRQSSEFIAMLGDNNREAEIVSPLSTMEQAMRNVLAERGDQEVVVNISAEGDLNALIRLLDFKIKKEQNRVGTSYVVTGGI
jgi:hypothetical protein